MRRWIKLIAALTVLAILLAVCIGMGKLLMAAIQLIATDGGEIEKDPMFAEEAERVTLPPELTEKGDYIHEDVSDQWIIEDETPVDKTADQLAQEDWIHSEIDS